MSVSLLCLILVDVSTQVRAYRSPEDDVVCVPLPDVCGENTSSPTWDKGGVDLVYIVTPTGPRTVYCVFEFVLFLMCDSDFVLFL